LRGFDCWQFDYDSAGGGGGEAVLVGGDVVDVSRTMLRSAVSVPDCSYQRPARRGAHLIVMVQAINLKDNDTVRSREAHMRVRPEIRGPRMAVGDYVGPRTRT
jgi:hypothetical protein